MSTLSPISLKVFNDDGSGAYEVSGQNMASMSPSTEDTNEHTESLVDGISLVEAPLLVASSLLSCTLSSSDVDVDEEVNSLSCEIGCESSSGGWRVVESCCLSASSELGPPSAYINCDTLTQQ